MPGIVFVVEARRKHDIGVFRRIAFGLGFQRVRIESGNARVRKRLFQFVFERLYADSGTFKVLPAAFGTRQRHFFGVSAMVAYEPFFGRDMERERQVATRTPEGMRAVLAHERPVCSTTVEIDENASLPLENPFGPLEKLPADVCRELRGS